VASPKRRARSCLAARGEVPVQVSSFVAGAPSPNAKHCRIAIGSRFPTFDVSGRRGCAWRQSLTSLGTAVASKTRAVTFAPVCPAAESVAHAVRATWRAHHVGRAALRHVYGQGCGLAGALLRVFVGMPPSRMLPMCRRSSSHQFLCARTLTASCVLWDRASPWIRSSSCSTAAPHLKRWFRASHHWRLGMCTRYSPGWCRTDPT
jgi:hypothetical protein